MTDSFNVRRFGRLWRAHWAESWRYYAWFTGVLAMVDVVFVAIFLGTQSRSSLVTFQFEGQAAWYLTGLLVSGTIFAGRHFRELADPGSALTMLMRPASALEKWLLAFVCTSLLFPLVYTLGYCLLNYPVVQLAKVLYVAPDVCENCRRYVPDFRFYVPLFTNGSRDYTSMPTQTFFRLEVFFLLALWSVQALVLSGTVFFKRSPVLRTALLCFLLGVTLLLLGTVPAMGVFWSPPADEVVMRGTVEYVVSLMLWTCLPMLLWMAAFFHLKEREVS